MAKAETSEMSRPILQLKPPTEFDFDVKNIAHSWSRWKNEVVLYMDLAMVGKAWFPYGRKRVVTVVEIDFVSISTTVTTRLRHVYDHMETRLKKEDTKVKLFMYIVGSQGREIYETLTFDKNPKKEA